MLNPFPPNKPNKVTSEDATKALQDTLKEELSRFRKLRVDVAVTIAANKRLNAELEAAIADVKKKGGTSKQVFSGMRMTKENSPGEFFPKGSRFRMDVEATLLMHGLTEYDVISNPKSWTRGSVQRCLQQSILGRSAKRLRKTGVSGSIRTVSRAEWLDNYRANNPSALPQ